MSKTLLNRIIKAQKFVDEHNAKAQPKDKVDIDPVVLASFADKLLPSKKDISRKDFIARLKLIMLPDKERPLHAVNEDMLIRGSEDTKVDPSVDRAYPHKLDIDPDKLLNQEIKDVAEIKKRNLDMQVRAIKKNTKERHLHELYELGKKYYGLENTNIAPSVQTVQSLSPEILNKLEDEGVRALTHSWRGASVWHQKAKKGIAGVGSRPSKTIYYPGRAAQNIQDIASFTSRGSSNVGIKRRYGNGRAAFFGGDSSPNVENQYINFLIKDPAAKADIKRINKKLNNIFEIKAYSGEYADNVKKEYYNAVGSDYYKNNQTLTDVVPNIGNNHGYENAGIYSSLEDWNKHNTPNFLRNILLHNFYKGEKNKLKSGQELAQNSYERDFVLSYLYKNKGSIEKYNQELLFENWKFQQTRQAEIDAAKGQDNITRAINESDAQTRKLTEEKYHQIRGDRENILREIDIKNKEIWELQKLYGFEKIRNLSEKDIKDNKTNRRYGAPKFDVMPEQYYQLGDLTDDPVIRGLDLKQFVESQKEDKFKVGRGKYTFDKKNMLATIDRAYQTKDASILGRYIKRLNEDLQNDFSFQERTTPAQREFEAAKLIKLRNDRKLLYRALDKEDKEYLNQVMYSINAYTAFPHEYSADIAKKHFKLLSDITRTHGTPVNLEPDNREKTRNYDYHINNIRLRLDYDVPAVKTQELGGALYEDRYQSMLKAYNDYVQPAEKEKKVRYPKTNAQKIAGLYRQETGDLNTDRISDNYLRARAVYQDELDKKRWNEIVNSKQNNLANKNRFNILFGQLRGAESVRNTVNNLPHGTFDFYENFLRRKQ